MDDERGASEDEKEVREAERGESAGEAVSIVVERGLEEVGEGGDDEEERETSGSESKAREFKRLVSSVEARLRDCDNS